MTNFLHNMKQTNDHMVPNFFSFDKYVYNTM